MTGVVAVLDLPMVGSTIRVGRHLRESAMHRFKVEKMGCGGCAKSVARAVQGIEPNAIVEVDLGAKLVAVSGATGPEGRIAQAITVACYPAQPLLAAA
jgi:copper chaperone